METVINEKNATNTILASSPFGTLSQNKLCENVFLNDTNCDFEISDEMKKLADSVARQNKANLIPESLSATGKTTFSFTVEKEADDCSGMEISHYNADVLGNFEMAKNVFIKYLSNETSIFNSEDFRQLQNARENVQGTLKILEAIAKSADEATKEKFEIQKNKIEEHLKKYDIFIKKLGSMPDNQ